jgi:Mor family transcriptional regulator
VRQLRPEKEVNTRTERSTPAKAGTGGELIKILMKDYNLSKASVYRYLGKTVENSG